MIDKKKQEKIREIIAKHHNRLLITLLGAPDGAKGILEKIYEYNLLNQPVVEQNPKTWAEAEKQVDAAKTALTAHQAATVAHLKDNLKALIEKQKSDSAARLETLMREYNRSFSLDQAGLHPDILKNSVAEIKSKLKDFSGDGNRNWERIATTEVSNAIGLASVDRMVEDKEPEELAETLVYRIVVNDAALCKWCKRFYLDRDGSPKVYRLSTILGNGSNYGLKTADWKPVSGATHPFERCSQWIELKASWKVLPGGKQEFIGKDKWLQYIESKIQS